MTQRGNIPHPLLINTLSRILIEKAPGVIMKNPNILYDMNNRHGRDKAALAPMDCEVLR
jgi:hypothetical protein